MSVVCHYLLGAQDTVVKWTFVRLTFSWQETHHNCVVCHTVMSARGRRKQGICREGDVVDKKKKKESISCKRSDEYERGGELQVPQSKINLSTDHMPAKE